MPDSVKYRKKYENRYQKEINKQMRSEYLIKVSRTAIYEWRKKPVHQASNEDLVHERKATAGGGLRRFSTNKA